MAKIANFFEKFNVMAVMLMACIVTLISSCKNDDLDDTGYSTKSIAKKVETSNMTKDDYYHTATLQVTVTNTDPQGIEKSLNGDATAKVTASVESDPVETSNMEKTFAVGEINTVEQNGNDVATCNIAVNGTENNIPVRVVMERCDVFDNHYSLKVTDIAVDKANVKLTETSKKSGEKARQAVYVPLNVTIAAVGTKKPHSVVVPTSVTWEQFQKESTPVVDHEELDSYTWVIKDGMVKVNHHIRQIWTGDHEDTFVDYPAEAPYNGNVINLEDKTVKNWKASLSRIEGLTAGTPSAIESAFEYYKIEMREDIYSAIHETEGETKCVYFWSHPRFTFKKGDIEHVCEFISPSFSETADELLDATSMKSGYDLKVFRNAVTVKYGNAETGIDERVMEERQNLYKQAKAVADVEVISKTKAYPAFAVDYVVKYRLVYNDGTKSEEMTTTTSRPWSLSYDGSWSMTANGEVTQSTTAIVLTKGESKTERQEIANGYWDCTSTNYTAVNKTTVDGQVQTNGWKLKVPTKMLLNLYGTDIPFDEDAPKAEAKDIKITLTNSTATQEDYKFSENLNVTVGTDTEISEGYGFVTKAVEVTVVSWKWENDYQTTSGNTTKAGVDKVYTMSDGSTRRVHREFTYTGRNATVVSYWETTEVSNAESTGAAGWSVLANDAKSDGDWKFSVVKYGLNFGVTCAGSTQKDIYEITEVNGLSVEVEGDVFTFPAMTYDATANASQSKTAESDTQTEYTHSNTPSYTFNGYTMNLASALGKIFVNKTVTPESHNGYFPAEYGKIEGYNRVACRNPKNQKDWGIGVSVKFTNGSICGFITKDGIIEWGSFESGSTVWQGASPDGNGTLMNCNAKDASTAMKWTRESTINMLSYSDGTISGFHNGNNTVVTSMFPGSIEQKDGGKWQNLTMAGVKDASGRTNFDSSF